MKKIEVPKKGFVKVVVNDGVSVYEDEQPIYKFIPDGLSSSRDKRVRINNVTLSDPDTSSQDQTEDTAECKEMITRSGLNLTTLIYPITPDEYGIIDPEDIDLDILPNMRAVELSGDNPEMRKVTLCVDRDTCTPLTMDKEGNLRVLQNTCIIGTQQTPMGIFIPFSASCEAIDYAKRYVDTVYENYVKNFFPEN